MNINHFTCNVTDPERPRRLFVLVNPASGHFKGRTIFENVVAPIFQMAGVHIDVTSELTIFVAHRKIHFILITKASDYLKKHSLL